MIDNLDAILAAENMQTDAGCTIDERDNNCLMDLFKMSAPMSEIAIARKRSTAAIRGRLNKLGFDLR